MRRCARRFRHPAHAGPLDGAFDRTLHARAEASAAGSLVELAAGLVDGKIAQMRFKLWGCPHLIAAAEALCQTKEGENAAALRHIDLAGLMGQLAGSRRENRTYTIA